MSRFNLTLLIGSLLVGLALDVTAQDRPPKTTLPKLAIEIVDQVHAHFPPFPVFGPPSEGGYTEIGPPPRRPEWKQPQDTAPLTRVRIRSITENNGARIRIAAVFDDSEPVDAPGPKYGQKEQTIASYFAQVGETITVSELENFGFDALVLRVVKYSPPPDEDTATIFPEVVDNLKSVAFVDLQSEGSHFYRLTLENLATKSIVALTVRIPPVETQTIEGTRKNPLVRPAATLQTSISVSGSNVLDNSRPTLVIQTALFDDGSYEGDVVAAAEMASRIRGRQIQLGRFLQLLEHVVEQPDGETAAKIQDLKNDVAKLRIDLEASLIDELQAQFPALPRNNGRAWLASRVMDGLKNGRHHALYLLNDLESKRTRNPAGFDLRQELSGLREQIARQVGNQ